MVFTRDELPEFLDALMDRLVGEGGVGVEIRIVGGAAIALAHDDLRDLTGDIDAIGANGPGSIGRSFLAGAAEMVSFGAVESQVVV